MAYIPKVNDYVRWIDPPFKCDEGWVYFVCPEIETAPGFPKQRRYITIEVGVKDKPKDDEFNGTNLHSKIHTLLLCFEEDWHKLEYVKSRRFKKPNHHSQVDD